MLCVVCKCKVGVDMSGVAAEVRSLSCSGDIDITKCLEEG